MAHCSPLLQAQPALQVVNLEDTGLSADAARLLCEYLTTTTPGSAPTTALRGLNVHGNRLESDGMLHIATIVSKSPLLQCLHVSSIGAEAPAVVTLVRALSTATELMELDISDNSFDDDCASALSEALEKQPHITRLVLSDLNMKDAQLHLIVDALLTSHAPLTELHLSGNELTSKGADEIVRLIAAPQSRLAVIDLSSNELEDEGVLKVADAVVADGAPSLSPLVNVNISENEASQKSIIHFASRLIRLPDLAKLDFSQNNIPASVSRRVAEAFAPSVVFLSEDDDLDEDTDTDQVPLNNEDSEIDAGEEDEPFDGGDYEQGASRGKSPLEQRSSPRNDEIEIALQALETVAKNEMASRSNFEPTSPRSSSEVTRLVQFFTSGKESTDTENEKEDNGSPGQSATDEIEPGSAATDEGIPGTPPPSRFIGGITSPITPPPSVSTAQRVRSPGILEDDNVLVEDEEKKKMDGDVEVQVKKEPDEIVADRRDEDEDVEMEDVGDEGNVILSARKLKESIVSLSKEISDVAGELEMPPSPQFEEGDTNDGDGVNDDRSALLPRARSIDTQKRPLFSTSLVDIIGAGLVAAFVLVIVMAITKSQEESTFSFRPL